NTACKNVVLKATWNYYIQSKEIRANYQSCKAMAKLEPECHPHTYRMVRKTELRMLSPELYVTGTYRDLCGPSIKNPSGCSVWHY
ncbi:MAG: hypothetical protein QMD32_09810, partial [Smithellaceae bacterium]|nr:hypothetical protein [Smithellaceae bacterium]